MQHTINIGEDDFRSLRESHHFYVDKTAFLEDFIKLGPKKVSLFTRPRRFGKSLALSMMGEFFDCRKDSKEIFEGLKISRNTEICSRWMNKFPIIRLNFKDIEGDTFQCAYEQLKEILSDEFLRHEYLIKDNKIHETRRDALDAVLRNKADDQQIINSIFNLSHCLNTYYGSKPIILIDEYDVPLAKAYAGGYYNEMIGVIRKIFNRSLKSNENLHFAVLTGCLRISRESLFTGLNNIKYYDVTSTTFDYAFGLTDDEVNSLLEQFGLSDKIDEVRAWYDGYRFGEMTAIYNPWSILNYIDDHITARNKAPESYWANTSGNDIQNYILKKNSELLLSDIDKLLDGKCINKIIDLQTTYTDLQKKTDAFFWSIMYATGYVTKASETQLKNSNLKLAGEKIPLVIPNKEVFHIWKNRIVAHIDDEIAEYRFENFNEAFWNGDEQTVESELNRFMMKSKSSFDVGEYIYHMMVLAIVSGQNETNSNKEAGLGRYDISVYKGDKTSNTAAIVEIKKAENSNLLDNCARKALKQIADKKYDFDLREEGCRRILHWGMAFHGKTCRAMVRTISNARAYKRLPADA